MSDKHCVVWTETAEKDLTKIIEYIAQDCPATALDILQKIKSSLSKLYEQPERCRIVPELYAQGITPYREMIIKPWRIMFRISNSDVYVLSVLDSRQNIEDILLNRFLM